MSMPAITLVAGAALALLGIGTFVGSGSSHSTALIPAALGVGLIGLGAVAFQDRMRKHAMHGAATVSLVAFLGGFVMAIPRLGQLLSEGRTTRADLTDSTTSTLALIGMGLIGLVHVALCVNSFIQARKKAREQSATNP